MPSRTVEVTLSALLCSFRQFGLADPHPIFGSGTTHVPESLAGGLDDAARDELSRLGLSDRGRVSDEFEDAVYALAQPEAEYLARVANQGEEYTAFVGVRGRAVVTAVRDGERVLVTAEDDRRSPAEALIATLPPYRPAKVPRISLSQHEFRGEDGYLPDDRSRSARAVDALLEASAFGQGEINVSIRGCGRGRRVADGVLLYRDLADGRVAFDVSGEERNRYIEVLPGDNLLMAQQVAALRSSLDR